MSDRHGDSVAHLAAPEALHLTGSTSPGISKMRRGLRRVALPPCAPERMPDTRSVPERPPAERRLPRAASSAMRRAPHARRSAAVRRNAAHVLDIAGSKERVKIAGISHQRTVRAAPRYRTFSRDFRARERVWRAAPPRSGRTLPPIR
ncbi:hypothetical protein [Burkholderia mayonis]|uniref:hypothetical protein n=1 Tax=Burkholderia mayonis TaxID=1385591 RepID=UPI00131F4640|nr:hypothetical protein [Burkholderia mayonis]